MPSTCRGGSDFPWWTRRRETLDPLRHPDLQRLGRELRRQMDDTLDAELNAARAAARRRLTLRDALLTAEDRREEVAVSATDGQVYRGNVIAVGTDHCELEDGRVTRLIAIDHIVMVRIR